MKVLWELRRSDIFFIEAFETRNLGSICAPNEVLENLPLSATEFFLSNRSDQGVRIVWR